MSFDLNEFLVSGLIDSLNNGLIPSELITVYAGNYLAKSMITSDDVNKIKKAVDDHKEEIENEKNQLES